MFAGDVFIDRILTNDEIAIAISRLLSIAQREVLIVEDIEKIERQLGPDVRVLSEKLPMNGDFVLRLAKYLRDSSLEKTVEQIGNRALTESFCDQLGCHCLISDDSANPYSWLLIQGTGRVENVSIDLKRSNEEESKIFIEPMAAEQDEIKYVA